MNLGSKQDVGNSNYVMDQDIFPMVGIRDRLYGEWKVGKSGNEYFVPCGRAVKVTKVLVEVETGEESLVLETVTNLIKGERKEVEISRGLISSIGIPQLCRLGFDVQQHNIRIFTQLIQKQEMFLGKTFVHKHLGWARTTNLIQGNTLIFKGKKAIGNFKSYYVGQKVIGRKGKYQLWKKMIEEEVIGNASLEFAVILGLSATLVGFLNLREPCESLIIHLCGDSSTGKTTAARLAVSVAGKPSFQGNTLMSTFQATKNAITKSVANNYGMPQVFDELSMFSGSLTDLIYTLASGKEKGRLNKDSSMKASESWATTIITTGEKDILIDAKQNAGLSVRTFAFEGVQWTKDAAQAEKIASVISENYGFATLEFARCLLSYDMNRLDRKLKYWRKEYLEKTTIDDAFTERIAKKYAVLLVTNRIARKALGLKFNTKRILKFILENEKRLDVERDLGLKAYELFLEFVETNKSLFGLKSGGNWTTAKGNQNYGFTEKLAVTEEKDGVLYGKHIIIAKTKFDSFCSQAGFEDSKVVLKNWKSKGLLKSEADRLVSDRKINPMGNTVKCYIIRVSIERAPQDLNMPHYTRTNGQTGEEDFFA